MKKEVQGNLDGLRSSQLQWLENLFAYEVPVDQVATTELIEEMARLTSDIRREVAIYLNRAGQVLVVMVGDNQTVSLPEVRGRRALHRLSGIRCLHTHPGGSGELSAVDLSALCELRLDLMAAIGVKEGRPTDVSFAYLEGVEGIFGQRYQVVGPLSIQEINHNNIMLIIKQLEKDIHAASGQKIGQPTERAILVGLETKTGTNWSGLDSLEELKQLALSAGAVVVDTVLQKKERPDPAFYLGYGKVEQLGLRRQASNANLIIFDDELSPAQLRNLEDTLGVRVIDRTALILDIFAQRAKTREGKLQVELAQLKYLLPRLVGQGRVLSRLGGGIGTRGPGETKLETDRRHIRRRIAVLEHEIDEIKRHRQIQRMSRRQSQLPIVALVGYTNAGKSTLLNCLSLLSQVGGDEARLKELVARHPGLLDGNPLPEKNRESVTLLNPGAVAEDKLFATLDPITRRVDLPNGRSVLVTDTVGFVRKLPHHLIAAFRATLEEVTEADLLLHVIDVSHPAMEEQMEAVFKVLGELGALDKPIINVYNKIDRLQPAWLSSGEQDNLTRPAMGRVWDQDRAVAISARHLLGLADLQAELMREFPIFCHPVHLHIPYDQGWLIGWLHRESRVLSEECREDGIKVVAVVKDEDRHVVEPYLIVEIKKSS